MAEEQNLPNHISIFNFWKDLCITPYGEVISKQNKNPLDENVIIDLYEPRCWCCGAYPNFCNKNQELYEKILKSDKPEKVWEMNAIKSFLNKCHLIPKALGGSPDPSNLFLMCEKCHKLSPDVSNPKYFLAFVYNMRKTHILGVDKTEMNKYYDYFKNLCNTYNKDINYYPEYFNSIEEITKRLNGKITTHGSKYSIYSMLSCLCDLLPENKVINIKYNNLNNN